jgi:cysteinyl-tRNA synthetase
MDEDLAMPAALGALHDEVRAGNAALDSGDDAAVAASLASVLAMTTVLGINPLDWAASTATSSGTEQALDHLIQGLIAGRNAARADKDFAKSDAIRNQLQAAGITLEDAADGTHWSVN